MTLLPPVQPGRALFGRAGQGMRATKGVRVSYADQATPPGQPTTNSAEPGGAYDQLRRAVLARIEDDRLDPVTDLEAVRATIEGYQRRAHLGAHPTLPAQQATGL